jgi:ABC-2 type transport system ATP-binding protein
MNNMPIMQIKDLLKQSEDALIFPAFSLQIFEGQSVAIYSNINVRRALLDMLSGETAISDGEITVGQWRLSARKSAYHPEMGILFADDAMYKRLNVNEHFRFFKQLYGAKSPIDDLLHAVRLEPKKYEKTKSLSHSEKKRVRMAKLLFQDPSLFVFEEPTQNVDFENKSIFYKLVENLQQGGKGVLILTENMKSAVALADRAYHLDEKGLRVIEAAEKEIAAVEGPTPEEETVRPLKFEKIPTRVDEKMVLFDPPEIDYIEGRSGQSNIYVNGEAFPGIFTLAELEARLKPYGFFRCHRSYIVNLQKVCEIITWTRNSYGLILDDKARTEIPLSKTKMAELKEMLGLK